MTTRAQNIAFAKLALHAKRYDDMMDYMDGVGSMCIELDPDEVFGFSFAIPADDQMIF